MTPQDAVTEPQITPMGEAIAHPRRAAREFRILSNGLLFKVRARTYRVFLGFRINGRWSDLGCGFPWSVNTYETRSAAIGALEAIESSDKNTRRRWRVVDGANR